MTVKELKQILINTKKQIKERCPDKSDEVIEKAMLNTFLEAYKEGRLGKEDIICVASIMGYDVDEKAFETN